MVLLMFSCSDKISDDEHYKTPDWLKGNAYEVLQKEGKYSIFLRGIDLSGYKSIVDGNSILTVMAPDDDAFTEYLKSNGYSSIDEMYASKPDYLTKLITYHLMYYAFDWSKMVNFRPSEGDGATEDQKQLEAGYYYKHRTHSIDPIEQLRIKLTTTASADTLIHLYHYERYLPVFSNKLFETKGIDPVYNYQYFYPNTEWNGIATTGGGFNVSNAKVSDTDNVITDNGYLYHISQVLEPLNTIYDELKSHSKYSDFLNLYDSYSTYELADNATNTSLGYQAYIHAHGDLPNIAWEWPTTSYLQMNILEKNGYNIFAPSNTAIAEFFTTYWTSGCGYGKLEDLDPMILKYFIYQSFTKQYFICFPEEIKKGTVLTSYGTPVNVDPDKVTDRIMCENGVLYGMDHEDAPAIFTSVVGPAFRDTTYVDYLYALDGSSLMLSLASNKSQFVTLIPSNKQFQNSDPKMRLYSTINGKELQQYSDEAGDYTGMSSGSMLSMVNMHTAANISQLNTAGKQVIQTNVAYNYWFVNDGKITTNAMFNQQIEPSYKGSPFVEFHNITNNGSTWDNGSAYSYDAESVFKAASGDGLAHKLSVCNDKNYSYYLFAQLLQKAGLATDGLSTSIIPTEDTRFIVFIPTNDAITENLKSIPGCSGMSISNGTLNGTLTTTNKALLATYLRSYFITSIMNTITTYPYPGSVCKGIFYTTGSYKMNISDNGSQLSVNFTNANSNNSVNVNSKYYNLPFAFNDGCFHLIDGILK